MSDPEISVVFGTIAMFWLNLPEKGWAKIGNLIVATGSVLTASFHLVKAFIK